MKEQNGFPSSSAPDLDDEGLVERLIEEVLQGHPRSARWRAWRQALEERLHKLLEFKRKGMKEVPDLDERIRELKRYIAALREEELLTEFVEQQVRMVVRKAKLGEISGDETPLGTGGIG